MDSFSLYSTTVRSFSQPGSVHGSFEASSANTHQRHRPRLKSMLGVGGISEARIPTFLLPLDDTSPEDVDGCLRKAAKDAEHSVIVVCVSASRPFPATARV
jgi:hypothetical protein